MRLEIMVRIKLSFKSNLIFLPNSSHSQLLSKENFIGYEAHSHGLSIKKLIKKARTF